MPYAMFETPLGHCALAWSEDGVTWLQLPEETPDATRARLLAKRPDAGAEDAKLRSAPKWVKDAVARVRAHLAGKPQALGEVPLDLSDASPLHTKIYRALQSVPAGKTTTYGDLAKIAGSPGASRAVGRAMATTPFPLLVPCHRVVAAGGKEGGFSAYGGLVTKEKLLALEGGALRAQASLFAGDGPTLPFDWKKAVRTLSEADPVLGKLIERVGDRQLTLKATEGTFAALAESIVYQQLTGKAAATIFGRVRALYAKHGGKLDPARVLATKDEDLRACGLSGSKLAGLKDLARRTNDGEIPTLTELSKMDDEEVIERLTVVRGVGRWTVEMLLIFRLGRPDVLPLGDYGVQKGFLKTFAPRDKAGKAGDLAKRAERWRPFRSVGSWYMWRALEVAPANAVDAK
jgi:methylated-DNA-[protein]-cysteine S-methyltransferase